MFTNSGRESDDYQLVYEMSDNVSFEFIPQYTITMLVSVQRVGNRRFTATRLACSNWCDETQHTHTDNRHRRLDAITIYKNYNRMCRVGEIRLLYATYCRSDDIKLFIYLSLNLR